MDKYLPFLQIVISLVMIAFATLISDLVKGHEEGKKIPGWQFWHDGVANAQWGFASFYIVLIWTENSTFFRIVALVFFLICAIAFGLSAGYASRIAQTSDPHFSATANEKRNNGVAGISLVIAIVFAFFLALSNK